MRKLALLLVGSLFVASCVGACASQNEASNGASTRATGDKSAESETGESNADFPADSTVSELVFRGDTPLVVKIRPDRLGDLRRALDRQIVDVEEHPTTRKLRAEWEKIGETGPVDYLAETFDLTEAFEHLDPDRPVFARVDAIGDAALQRAAEFALPHSPSGEWPVGTHLRLLVPSDDPDALADRLEEQSADSDLPERSQIRARDSWVRVDLLIPVSEDLSEERIDAAFEEAGAEQPSGERPTATPTLKQFLDSSAPAAIYGNLGDFKRLGYALSGFGFGSAYQNAPPEMKAKGMADFIRSVHELSAIGPAADQTFLDAALEVRTTESDGLVVDLGRTRTARGSEVYEKTTSSETLPELAPVTDAKHEPVGQGTAVVDWSALAETSRALEWADIPDLDWDQLVWKWRQRTSHMPRFPMNPFASYGLLASPEYLGALWSSALHRGLSDRTGFPLPPPDAISVRFARYLAEDSSRFRMVGSAIFEFEPGGRERARRRVETMLQRAKETLEVDIEAVGDRKLRIHAAVGTDLSKVRNDKRRTRRPGVRATLRPKTVEKLLGDGPEALLGPELARLADIDSTIRLVDESSPAESRLRMTLGVPEIEPPEVAESFDPPTTDSSEVCRTKLQMAVGDYLKKLKNILIARPDLEAVQSLVSDYDELADSCSEADSDVEDRRKWARGRFRWWMAQRLVDTDGVTYFSTLARRCLGETEASDQPRRESCTIVLDWSVDFIRAELRESRQLVEKLEDRGCDLRALRESCGDYVRKRGVEKFLRRAERTRKRAGTLFEKGCDLGDEACCRIADAEDPPPLPTPEKLRSAIDQVLSSKE